MLQAFGQLLNQSLLLWVSPRMNFTPDLQGFGTNRASVNSTHRNGVKALLQEKITLLNFPVVCGPQIRTSH